MLPIAHNRGHNPRQLDEVVPRSFNQLLHQSMDYKGRHRMGLWNDGILYALFVLLLDHLDVEGSRYSPMDTVWYGL